MLHLTDAQTVGKFLGEQNCTSCEAMVSSNSTAMTTYSPSVVTDDAASSVLVSMSSILLAAGLVVALAGL